MNVAQLIEQLQQMPQHLPVVAMANGEIRSSADPYFAYEVQLDRIDEKGCRCGPIVAIDFCQADPGHWPGGLEAVRG